jgi:glycosyltransferase involved in cell wall biosynthesis
MPSLPPILHALAWPGNLVGAARSLEETTAALHAAGHRVSAWLATATRVAEPVLPERLAARGVPCTHRENNTALDAVSVGALVRELRSLGAGAVLHTHGERALLWGRFAARAAGAKHVHTVHGFIENTPADARRAAVARRLLGGVDAVIAVHSSHARGLQSPEIIPNCIDADAFTASAPDPVDARRRLALTQSDRVYLYLGRLSYEKGADAIGVIQATLEEASAAARLVVAGRGPFAPGVEAMEDVRYLGQRSDAATLLAVADIVVMPSRQEGLPMTALEAAAMAVPVVGFAVGGLADAGLARTVPVEHTEDLARLALHLARKSEARAPVLAASRAALEGRFSPREHVAALEALYARL